MIKKYFMAMFLVVNLFACSKTNNKTISIQGHKLQLRLLGELKEDQFMQFDDLKIVYKLPDTSRIPKPEDFSSNNIRFPEEDLCVIAPTHTYLPNGNEWMPHRIPRGVSVTGWIKCLAYYKQRSGQDLYQLAMDDYLAFEGYFILERRDGEEINFIYSHNLPIQVTVLE